MDASPTIDKKLSVITLLRFRAPLHWDECAFCGSRESYLDELIIDDAGTKRFVCSDTDCCMQRRDDELDTTGGLAMKCCRKITVTHNEPASRCSVCVI
jgi:hypothetical protein